jgi:hypothetical protein
MYARSHQGGCLDATSLTDCIVHSNYADIAHDCVVIDYRATKPPYPLPAHPLFDNFSNFSVNNCPLCNNCINFNVEIFY